MTMFSASSECCIICLHASHHVHHAPLIGCEREFEDLVAEQVQKCCLTLALETAQIICIPINVRAGARNAC